MGCRPWVVCHRRMFCLLGHVVVWVVVSLVVVGWGGRDEIVWRLVRFGLFEGVGVSSRVVVSLQGLVDGRLSGCFRSFVAIWFCWMCQSCRSAMVFVSMLSNSVGQALWSCLMGSVLCLVGHMPVRLFGCACWRWSLLGHTHRVVP